MMVERDVCVGLWVFFVFGNRAKYSETCGFFFFHRKRKIESECQSYKVNGKGSVRFETQILRR